MATRQFCAYAGENARGCNGPPQYPAPSGKRCKSFKCSRCGARVGWCKGSGHDPGDPANGWCDDCWVVARGKLDMMDALTGSDARTQTKGDG